MVELLEEVPKEEEAMGNLVARSHSKPWLIPVAALLVLIVIFMVISSQVAAYGR